MHVLEYLRGPKCEKKPKDSLYAEYRLLCSGTLHRLGLGDWSKSEIARSLLDEPLLLFVASRPIDDDPLELVLQLTVPQVEEKEETKLGPSIHLYHPDDEVVRDLTALLSLLCRRLITGNRLPPSPGPDSGIQRVMRQNSTDVQRYAVSF
jgi:hypothetical protein